MARLVHSYAEDFGCLQQASLPLLNQGMTLIIGDNQDTRAAVNNGAGKTTLAKTICWGYFGETIDRDKFDEVMRWGAKRAYVRQVFEHDGTLWIVRRERTKGSPKLSLHRAKTRKFNVDFESVEQEEWQGSPSEVQAKIEELLGKDFRAFCNTQFFGQGDIGRFFSSTDSVQKETIHRVLRSDIFRRAEKYLREKVMKGFRQVVTDLEGELRSVLDKRGEYDLTELKRRQSEFENYRDGEIEKALSSIREVETNARMEAGELQVGRDRLDADLIKLRTAVAKFDKAKLQKQERAQETLAEKLRSETRDRAEQIGQIKSRIEGIEEQLDRLGGDQCPTCSSPLDRGKPLELKAGMVDKRDTWASGLRDFERSQREAQGELEICNSSVRSTREKLRELERLSSLLASCERDAQETNRRMKENQSQAKQKAEALLEQMEKIAELDNPHDSAVESAEARLAELGTEEERISSELKVAENELAMRDFWLQAFGAQGIPSLLLDSVMPFLTERSNYHLETLTDGDITVLIDNQRDLKKRGTKKEEITITCNIEGVPNSKPSVGQKKKLEIATNMALMDLAVARDGESDFLMMDDVLDGLDSEGEARVLVLLEGLRAKRSSIFVATHEAGFEEVFEKALLVTKKNQASTIREVK